MAGDGGKCPKCDKLLAPAAMFCTRCGTRLATVPPQPRVMLAPASPPTRPASATTTTPLPTPVLSYQVPPKLDPVAKPPPPAPSTSSNRPWVVIALLGVFAVKALVLTQSGSRTAHPTSPPRYMLPPPPRMPVTPATPGNTLAVPNPNAPRQIPGTSLSIDANGRVIVAQPTPATPATP